MTQYKCISAYKTPEYQEEWLPCPICGLRPRVWSYDNGRSTACGCGESKYDHFFIVAESIMSIVARCNGSSKEYKKDELKNNWNTWVKTGKGFFHGDLRKLGRW